MAKKKPEPVEDKDVTIKESELRKLLNDAEREEEYDHRMDPVCSGCSLPRKLGYTKHEPNCIVVKLKKQLGMELEYGE